MTVRPPPTHVAIIMDGNGRWAQARGLPRVAGHRAGVEAVRRVVRAAPECGIQVLTLYSFSTENWSRPPVEVEELLGLLRFYLHSELAELHRNGVCIRVIGERPRLPADIVTLIEQAEATTAANTGLTLCIALSYGGRQELVVAARRLAQAVADGRLPAAAIDETALAGALYTAGLPDPDLLIRTSGEQRLSNFLLWQAAYAELVFTDVLWPDFTAEHLLAALRAYAGRERRFGAVRA